MSDHIYCLMADYASHTLSRIDSITSSRKPYLLSTYYQLLFIHNRWSKILYSTTIYNHPFYQTMESTYNGEKALKESDIWAARISTTNLKRK